MCNLLNLLFGFRNSNREEAEREERGLQQPPENKPDRAAKAKKGKAKAKKRKAKAPKDRNQEPPVGVLLSLLIWLGFRNSQREEFDWESEEWDWARQRPPENRPENKANARKDKPLKGRKNEPEDQGERTVLPGPPELTLHETFGGDFPDYEISAVRRGCGMDDNEAFKRLNARLDSQDKFHAAKPKRGRRNQLEEQGSNASGSNTDEVSIDAMSDVEPAPAQESLNVDAENTRENPLVAPSVTSSPSLTNDTIAMNERPSYNRQIAGAGSSGDISHVEGLCKESHEVQVSERDVTNKNSSSNIAESNCSFTGEGDTCEVEGASQSNDGSVEDMASHNLPGLENGHREAGSGPSNNDIPANDLTLEQEEKEELSLPIDTSTAVLPEYVHARDADCSHLTSGTNNADVNIATQCNQSSPVECNLEGSANINRQIARCGINSPSPELPNSSECKSFADVVKSGGHQATVSHMVGKTSSISNSISHMVQVSENDFTSKNPSSNIAVSDCSSNGEGDSCKVESASQLDGPMEDMDSGDLPGQENGHHEVGPGPSNNDIPATASSLAQLTLGEEDKEVSLPSDNTSTTVLPERVLAQDAGFSHLSSYKINSDVNTAIPLSETDPVEKNLNDSSSSLNGSSSNNSTLVSAPAMGTPTFREYNPLYLGRTQDLEALIYSFLSEPSNSADHVIPQHMSAHPQPNRSTSLTGYNAASSSSQQSCLGDPRFHSTSSLDFHPCTNISAQTSYGTGYFHVQGAQANDLELPQQNLSSSRTLPTIPSDTHDNGPAPGQSASIQGNRFYYPNQQHVPDIQRQDQLQRGIPDHRYNRHILGQTSLPVQSDLPGSRYQNSHGRSQQLSQCNPANHFPQASSTELLPSNSDNILPRSSNQNLYGPIQRPSRRDAGSSTALDSRFQPLQGLSQFSLTDSILPSTAVCSAHRSLPESFTSFFSTPSSSSQNIQGQAEQLSEGDDVFPDPQSLSPSDILELPSDRTQGSSEEQKQP